MLKVEADGPVLRLTLHRPEVRNALNEELIVKLSDAMASVDSRTRVVVIGGEGVAFCAGADLAWMKQTSDYSLSDNERDALKVADMFRAFVECPAVVIARIHGPAYGGGAGLVAAADIAIATPEARFAFSEVRIGLVPATISSVVLSKIGASHARALFTTGEPFDVVRAQAIGLVHEVVSTDELDGAIESKIDAILSCAPGAVAEAKKLATEAPLKMDAAAKLLAQIRAGEEAREGFSAFIEKRKASYVVKR
jgi:enoyl-CoA hydratase/carnithine racemase